MEKKIQVNEQELMIKEYEGQRVVTMWDIARLHNVPANNIRTNFKRNMQHLIEGEDFFLLDKGDDFVSTLSGNGEMNQQTINRAKDIPVFTEAGYLLMTKPMTDEISWKVQRQLVNCYFKVKEQLNSGISDSEKLNVEAPKYVLEDINKTLEILTKMYKTMGVGMEDTFDMTKSLLKSAGVELPELRKVRGKDSFITLQELASDCGLFTPDGLPNKRAVVFIIKELSIDKSLLNITFYIDNDNNEKYSISYSKDLVGIIKEYIISNNYPPYIQSVSISGAVQFSKISYRK